MKVICCIPARLESTRLPRKLLLAETGKPLIVHTAEAAIGCDPIAWRYSDVVIATDSPEIRAAAQRGHRWPRIEMTRTDFRNGTERIASLFDEFDDVVHGDDLIIHWQADEPEIRPEHIAALIDGFRQIPGCDMATLADSATPQLDEPSVYTLVGSDGFARGFARNVSDFPRLHGTEDRVFLDHLHGWCKARRHIGVYAYRTSFLRWYASLPPSPNEQRESLEQLRALDAGCRIRVVEVEHPYQPIDTREDYDAFVARWKAGHQ